MVDVDNAIKQLMKNISIIRLSKNITQVELAQMINVSAGCIKKMENAASATSIVTFVKALCALGQEHHLQTILSIIDMEANIKPNKRQRAMSTKRRVRKINQSINQRVYQLLYSYGITLQDYIFMWKCQHGKCGNPGCNVKIDLYDRNTHVDHDHKTGKIRSLLCSKCNVALGIVNEDTDRINGLAEYIAKHNNIT